MKQCAYLLAKRAGSYKQCGRIARYRVSIWLVCKTHYKVLSRKRCRV